MSTGSLPNLKCDSFLDLLYFSGSRLTEDQKTTVKKYLQDWSDVLSHSDTNIGFTNIMKHNINLTDDTSFKQKHRKIPPAMYH